jgi:oxygen-independent coproporphyrinogen-3 oxidase
MLNALRLRAGFTTSDFERATGLSIAAALPTLEQLAGRGLLARVGDRFRPSELGFRFLNELLAAFLPDEAAAGEAGKLYTETVRVAPNRDFRHIVSELR